MSVHLAKSKDWTLFPELIKVCLSIIPCPVGGAGGFWLFNKIVFPDDGNTVRNLFNSEFIVFEFRALLLKLNEYKSIILVSCGNESEVRTGL